jgi:hypothetical protein
MVSRSRKRWPASRLFVPILASGTCALVLLVGCVRYDPGGTPPPAASNNTTAPTAGPSTVGPSGQSPTTPVVPPPESRRPTPITYTTKLPTGPDTLGGPGGAENTVYQALQRNDCDEAQRQLDGRNGFDRSWRGMRSPAYVLVFQAAIEACKRNMTRARMWFRRGQQLVGFSGIVTNETPTPCYVYKALVSVFDQIPAASVRCPGGDRPEWPRDADGATVKADPRVDPYPPPLSTTPSGLPSPPSDGVDGGVGTGGLGEFSRM